MNSFYDTLLELIAIATLIGGSLLAITQTNIKRMLAASSIVHSGYLLIALTSVGVNSTIASSAIMFYLISYFFSSVGAFGILSYLSSQNLKELTYDDFKGFADRRPYMALFMSIFMLSLAGFPSTIGFLGKFYIFTSAIEADKIFLAAVGIFTAFVSVYYYFKLVANIYFYPKTYSDLKRDINISTAIIGLLAIVVILGGIGSSLLPYLPNADFFIKLSIDAIQSLKP